MESTADTKFVTVAKPGNKSIFSRYKYTGPDHSNVNKKKTKNILFPQFLAKFTLQRKNNICYKLTCFTDSLLNNPEYNSS